MVDIPDRVKNVDLSKVMRTSFLDYAMSVIVARALPDVRDGLKPVHRRILYGMNELGVTPEKPYKKSARIVGEVMGKFHPHGDSAIYESMVRMAQDFSYRYMLVDGHGNFGSVDGDGAAAMRYTEARMSKITLEMLRDINKDTIDFEPNYDGTEREPKVLPARFPNLLVNGATGIAVGMTTNIPPHNLAEVISALHILMDDPDATVADLMEAIPGPDFPTGGIVMGKSGIRKAYETGHGHIVLRAKVDINELKNGREQIIVNELPYMVNKARLIERIAELTREHKIEGITDIKDESDREGMRITIDIRRDVSASVVLNNLYKLTLMQSSFGFNMLAIVDGTPKLLSLKQMLQHYLKHQEEVIRRRTEFDLKKAKARAHILEGLRIALDHIQAIIDIIRSSQSGDIAKDRLMNEYQLSDKQAQAILDMRLVRLTGLERDKVENDYKKTMDAIADYEDILAHKERINQIIYEELLQIQEKFGDERRTELLVGDVTSIEDEDLIEEESVIVTLTHNGYIKRMPTSEFKSQNRGGRGVQGMGVHEGDFIEQLISTSTHDELLFFTNTGKVYSSKGYQIPEYGRSAKGIPVINMLNIAPEEKIATVITVPKKDKENAETDDKFLFFTTKNGVVKRTAVSEFLNIRKNGLKAITLREGDELIGVAQTDGDQNMIIGTHGGYAVSFSEQNVRSMGRSAAGVRGIRLDENDYVIGADILGPNSNVFVISEQGYGKQTPASEYAIRGRGGKGVKTVNVTAKNGPLVGLTTVFGDEDIMVITNKGVLIRFDVANVSTTGRSTLGVHLINLEEGSFVSTMAKVAPEEVEDEEKPGSESENTVQINGDEQSEVEASNDEDNENKDDLD
ncbi:DNA gyrase subunit A [Ligilactobacillus pobuzihii]|nr:DNA gyrase subunit A [Ligilactobacillus pobuzihii]KRK10399.1 DNA gyrase subunit A [Ligilactobacillus pobuzihii E100301 = KCTC 13174]GEN47598.1 DNA gyrase subunit A [Ligilactobacillus pobuzihii]